MTPYFEIYRNNKKIFVGDKILNEPEWDNSVMEVPTTSLTLPLEYSDYLDGKNKIKIFIDNDCFYGIIQKKTVNENNINIDIDHIVAEWRNRQISVNNAVKDKNINLIYKSNASQVRLNKHVSPHIGIKAKNITLYHEKDKHPVSTSAELIRLGDAEAWNATGPNTGDRVKINSVTVWLFDDEKKTYTKVTDWSSIDTSKQYRVLFGTLSDNISDDTNTWVRVQLSFTEDKDKKNDDNEGEPSVVDTVDDILHDANFAYPGWQLVMSEEVKKRDIDYVFSRQNKLDALTKLCELTPDLFWRVNFTENKIIEIGVFGEHKQQIISKNKQSKTNAQILEAPTVTYDFSNVANIATVYSDKSNSGVDSLTLREIFNDKTLQDPKFPIVILRDAEYTDVNNERGYKVYTDKCPKIAPNGQREYAVMDIESIALEAGEVIETTFAFDDLGPFNIVDDEDGTQPITDKDRIECGLTAYHASIKKLIGLRRTFTSEVTCTKINANVGDMVLFDNDYDIWSFETCTNYMKKVIMLNDWFYVSAISYKYINGVRINTVTLSKYLRVERETSNGN